MTDDMEWKRGERERSGVDGRTEMIHADGNAVKQTPIHSSTNINPYIEIENRTSASGECTKMAGPFSIIFLVTLLISVRNARLKKLECEIVLCVVCIEKDCFDFVLELL